MNETDMKRQETDTDYILLHLQHPVSLLDAEFLEWLQDPGHRRLFEEVRNQQEAFMRFNLEDSIDVEREYERQRAKIRFSQRRTGWRWMVAAACVVAVFGISFIIWNAKHNGTAEEKQWASLKGRRSAELILANGERLHLANHRIELRGSDGMLIVNDSNCNLAYHRDTIISGQAVGKDVVYHTLVIPVGADYTLHLADGTKVRLNCETKFRFPVEFTGKERKVFLDGEAYFEVKKAGEWPFVVETECMQVKVTGTCFNVKSYRNEDVVHTTLVSGAVEVANHKAAAEPVGLTPSQQYYLDKRANRTEVRNVDVSLYTGWTEGMFVFKKQRLEDVMNTLARWYTIDVFYTGEAVKDLRISANLGRYEHIDSVLELLRAIEVDVERKGKTVIIGRK